MNQTSYVTKSEPSVSFCTNPNCLSGTGILILYPTNWHKLDNLTASIYKTKKQHKGMFQLHQSQTTSSTKTEPSTRSLGCIVSHSCYKVKLLQIQNRPKQTLFYRRFVYPRFHKLAILLLGFVSSPHQNWNHMHSTANIIQKCGLVNCMVKEHIYCFDRSTVTNPRNYTCQQWLENGHVSTYSKNMHWIY